jgi:serine O-acetyltransferase
MPSDIAAARPEVKTSRARNAARNLLLFLSGLRLIPIIVWSLLGANRELIFSDQDRWCELHHRPAPTTLWSRVALFVELLTITPEYRTVLGLRLGLAGEALCLLSPRISSLDITCDSIGRGFCIRHGHGSSISADSIGENCIIHQLVTIGYSPIDDTRPTIGNNVTIYPGATIVGAVNLGDNCSVAANSLVIANVPPGTTALGVPAKILPSINPAGLRK